MEWGGSGPILPYVRITSTTRYWYDFTAVHPTGSNLVISAGS